MVGDADDVAWPRLLGEVALAGEEEHRGLHRHRAPGADVLQFHAALEAAGRDPQKGDAIAVLRVDIGLHFEHETGRRTAPRARSAAARQAAGAAPGPTRQPCPAIRAPRNCSTPCRNRPTSHSPRDRLPGRRAGTVPSPSRPPRAIWQAGVWAAAGAIAGRRDPCSGPARPPGRGRRARTARAHRRRGHRCRESRALCRATKRPASRRVPATARSRPIVRTSRGSRERAC